jgi:transposase
VRRFSSIGCYDEENDMSQRTAILAEILGVRGWKVKEIFFEDDHGQRFELLAGYELMPDLRMVLRAERRWAPRCSGCGAICRHAAHEKLPARRWRDLSWAGRPVELEASLIRVKCKRCRSNPVEMVAWAEPYQRQTRRLQQHLALEAASMPVMHVAVMHGLGWGTVRQAEGAALKRWDATRKAPLLRQVGIDEKWLGRRHHLDHQFVTIISNLETGEPIWIGPNRKEETVRAWLATLSPEQKAAIQLFSMDMHLPFLNAIYGDKDLAHAAVVHDPFHIMKRAGEALDELRREVFFRASPEMRRIGRGARWLILRAWERCTDEQQEKVKSLLAHNGTLARAYQIKEELRDVLHAPDRTSMEEGLKRILRRTQARTCKPLRALHDSLQGHWDQIVALGEHHPATGRTEALNNNWETLVRRARGYRDHAYLLLKLRFMTANPIRTQDGVARFLALGLPAPMRPAA